MRQKIMLGILACSLGLVLGAADGTSASYLQQCSWINTGEVWCAHDSQNNCASGNDCDPNTGACTSLTCGAYCGLQSAVNCSRVGPGIPGTVARSFSHHYCRSGYCSSTYGFDPTGEYGGGKCIERLAWINTGKTDRKHTTYWVLDPACQTGVTLYCGNQALPGPKNRCYFYSFGASGTDRYVCAAHTYCPSFLTSKDYVDDATTPCTDAPNQSFNTPPVAQIMSPSAGTLPDRAVNFDGIGTDADGDLIVMYRWVIGGTNYDDPTSASLSMMLGGTNTVQFQVQDSYGDWSAPATVTFTTPAICLEPHPAVPAGTSDCPVWTSAVTVDTPWRYDQGCPDNCSTYCPDPTCLNETYTACVDRGTPYYVADSINASCGSTTCATVTGSCNCILKDACGVISSGPPSGTGYCPDGTTFCQTPQTTCPCRKDNWIETQ